MSAVLAEIASTLEATAGASVSANPNEAGYWKRIATALETITGTSTSANDTISGYMLRAALAAEVVSGTSGEEENPNESGYMKRIAEAMETQSGTGEGSWMERIRVASASFTAGSSLNDETTALIARMTTPPTEDRTSIIDTMISALKYGATSGSNIFAKLDALWVLAAADAQAASLDWTGHFDLTGVTGTGKVFTADQGWKATDNTKSITSGIILGTSTLGCSQTSYHIGGYMLGAGTGKMIGSTGNNFVQNANDGAQGNCRIISGLSSCQTPTLNAPRHHVGVRTGTSQTAYGNGTAGTTSSATGAFTGTIQVGNADSTSGVSANLALAHLGQALMAAEVLDLYNAAHAYLQAVASIA